MVYDIILALVGALSIELVFWIYRDWYWIDRNGTVRDVLPFWKAVLFACAILVVTIIGILL